VRVLKSSALATGGRLSELSVSFRWPEFPEKRWSDFPEPALCSCAREQNVVALVGDSVSLCRDRLCSSRSTITTGRVARAAWLPASCTAMADPEGLCRTLPMPSANPKRELARPRAASDHKSKWLAISSWARASQGRGTLEPRAKWTPQSPPPYPVATVTTCPRRVPFHASVTCTVASIPL
jgi:hypothetical protein